MLPPCRSTSTLSFVWVHVSRTSLSRASSVSWQAHLLSVPLKWQSRWRGKHLRMIKSLRLSWKGVRKWDVSERVKEEKKMTENTLFGGIITGGIPPLKKLWNVYTYWLVNFGLCFQVGVHLQHFSKKKSICESTYIQLKSPAIIPNCVP